MESMSLNGVVQAEYTYNARGQQVIRNLTQLGYRIHSVHDADGNRLAEYQIDNTTVVSTLLQEYVWHDGVPVAVVDGQTDEVFFVRTAHIGRPVFATDTAAVKVWEATYLPFSGVHVSTGGPIELRFPPLTHASMCCRAAGPVVPVRERLAPELRCARASSDRKALQSDLPGVPTASQS